MLAFFTLFHSYFSPQTGLFQSSYPVSHWFFYLVSSIPFFIPFMNFSAPEFLLIFYGFYLFVKFQSFCSLLIAYCLLDFIRLSLLSCRALSLVKTAILSSLWGKSQISMSLGSVTRRLSWSFCDFMFLWFFMFFGVLRCWIHIWSGSHLLQFLLTGLQGSNSFHQTCYRFWGFLWPWMDTPASHFLIPLMAEVLSFCVFSQSYQAPDRLLVASAVSLKVAHSPRLWSLLRLQTLACLPPVPPPTRAFAQPTVYTGSPLQSARSCGAAWGSLGEWGSVGGISPASRGQASWLSPECSQQGISYTTLYLLLPPSWLSLFSVLDAAREKWVSLAASCTAQEARSSLTGSPFPSWEKSQAI